jgi:hypothetical protein
MAKESRRRTEVQAERTVCITTLDECVLVEVLRAACTARTLAQLASLSKQLCNLARSRVPVCLIMRDQEQASYVIRSDARGRVAFSSCTQLQLVADDPVMCCMATGVLRLAQQWAALGQLELYLLKNSQQQQLAPVLEHCASSVLISVAPLKQLRRLVLESPALGACSAGYIMQLTQLTYLELTAPGAAPAAAADLGALSRFTNLVELHLNWALAPHLPAGPEGPYCLPSSLVRLELSSKGHTSPAPMACWVAHLPGCPQLQRLVLAYGEQQHLSAHPSNLVGVLAQYNRQLRTFIKSSRDSDIHWTTHVEGLADVDPLPEDWEWVPDAALAALTGLECLQCRDQLDIRDQTQWQHVAQLTGLTKLSGALIWCVPELQPGSTLRLVELLHCGVVLSGYDLGRLLLTCPLLEQATIGIDAFSGPPPGPRLPPHPKLASLYLGQLSAWGDSTEELAQFAQLVPVLSGVPSLELQQWLPSDTRAAGFPDLSPCTALTALMFGCKAPGTSDEHVPPEQEQFLSMVAPLVQLRRLVFTHAPRLNARVAFALQSMLPQLQYVELQCCGKLLPVAAGGDAEQRQAEEQAALEGVQQLLRPGLVLVVDYEEGEEEE